MAGAAKSRATRERVERDSALSAARRAQPRQKDIPVPVPVSPASVRVWNTNSKVLPSGVLGTKVSELDKTTSMFSQAVLVEHDEAFTLKPLILNEGPLAGRRVLVLVKNVSFLDLPGEVRNQIWNLVLEKGKTLAFRGAHHVTSAKPQGHDSTATALARTNKRVAAEVLAMVYGSTTFNFGTLADLDKFVQRIGGARSYLRYVNIQDLKAFRLPSPTANPWTCLQGLTNLQSLTFCHEGVFLHALADDGTIKLVDLFNRLKPFLHAWLQANKDQRDSVRVSELIKFASQECCSKGRYMHLRNGTAFCSHCRRSAEMTERHAEKVSERLRELIVKEFGLAEYAMRRFGM